MSENKQVDIMANKGKKQALVVDDDSRIRRTVRRVLERAGWSVTEAKNGRVALQVLDSKVVNLVITDLFMPEMEGIELIQKLRARVNCPAIIAISGGSMCVVTNFLPVARLLGADVILNKPFEGPALLKAIEGCKVNLSPGLSRQVMLVSNFTNQFGN